MLLTGYQKIGFDLGKPALRAEMERDMNKVANGEMTRQQAIDRSCNLMKPLFVKVTHVIALWSL